MENKINPMVVLELLSVGLVESDRGAVISCGAALEQSIKDKLVPESERFPFDTLIKILSGYIFEERLISVLQQIKKIRNIAAHIPGNFVLQDHQNIIDEIVRKSKGLKYFDELSSLELDLTKTKGVLPHAGQTAMRDVYKILPNGNAKKNKIEFVVATSALVLYVHAASETRKVIGSTLLNFE